MSRTLLLLFVLFRASAFPTDFTFLGDVVSLDISITGSANVGRFSRTILPYMTRTARMGNGGFLGFTTFGTVLKPIGLNPTELMTEKAIHMVILRLRQLVIGIFPVPFFRVYGKGCEFEPESIPVLYPKS